VISKQLEELKNENCRLRETVAMLRKEMEHVNEMKRFETHSGDQDNTSKTFVEGQAYYLKSQVGLLLERFTDFNITTGHLREENQQ